MTRCSQMEARASTVRCSSLHKDDRDALVDVLAVTPRASRRDLPWHHDPEPFHPGHTT